ncbi:4Fe-4S binding protein [candidate division WOR-3 bacterium]|uniref:4Fe-4S binding protein n=1 Tax=candidate division WOR-3 bacterium TaxID=2052148 RepID=A0A937XBW5_UNCW3|nr:4Fe-4S binding protein [candidate division WOR-3 bacterium]
MTGTRFDISARTRVCVFIAIAGASAVSTLLLKFLGHFDWGVLYYGLASMLGLGLFLALFLGRPTILNRWLSFGVIALTGAVAAAFLSFGEKLPLGRVLVFGWLPFALIMLATVIFLRRRVAPYRVVQIASAVLLNAYIVAYLQNKILYQGFLKYLPQPILNCYGGPLAVFACPIGSTQQMVGMKLLPWLPLGMFIVVGAVVGRAACAWLCPFGMWQDLLFKVKVGAKAGNKRWASFGGVGLISALIATALIFFLKLPPLRVFLYAWLPFNLAVLAIVIKGKLELPRRMRLGGFLAAVGLALVVWFKFEIGYAVAAGFVAMILFGITGRWLGAILAAVAGFLLGWLGNPAFHVGPLSGLPLGIGLALASLFVVVMLDVVVKVSLPSNFLKFGVLLLVAGVASYLTAEPWFCKLCPQGTFGAGIPLVLWDPVNALRGLVGWLYWVKIGLLLFFIVAAIAIKRPFCRIICPIGAVYSPFNKGSLMNLKLDESTCIHCGICRKVCPMDIDPVQSQNQLECIRCNECVANCPKSCLRFRA